MSYIVTPDLGLELADPNTIQEFETTNVNSNFLLLEAGIMADRASLSALDARLDLIEPSSGLRSIQVVWEVASAAALGALSGAQSGDLAVMTGPTNIFTHTWFLPATTWRNMGQIRALTKSAMDSYITAVNAVANLDFEVGSTWYDTTTGITYVFTSATGAYKPAGAGLVRIKPTGVAGTGVTLLDSGRVDFATSPSVSVNGCFTSDFENYLLKWMITSLTTSGADLRWRARKAGSDLTSALYEAQETVQNNANNVTSQRLASAYAVLNVNTLGVQGAGQLELFGPLKTRHTFIESVSAIHPSASATALKQMSSHRVRDNVDYDGFTLFPSAGNLNGSLWVYGYNDN